MNTQIFFLSVMLAFISSRAVLAQADRWTKYEMPDLFGHQALAVTVDQQNHLWAITTRTAGKGSFGVDYFDGTKWTPASSIAGFGFADTTRLYDVCPHKDGGVLVAGDGGISQYDGTAWHHYKVNDSLAQWRQYQHIACDSSGNILVITRSPFPIDTLVPGVPHVRPYIEMFRFDGQSWETLFYADTLYGSEDFYLTGIMGICVDAAGDIWMASRQNELNIFGGLRRYHAGQWNRIDLEDGVSKDYARFPGAIAADSYGNVWIGYTGGRTKFGEGFPGGISRYNNGVWQHYGDSLGLVATDRAARSLAIDRTGGRWIGTSQGVVHHDDRGIHLYDPAADLGLPSSLAWADDLAVDHKGTLWLATRRGVLRLNEKVVSVKNEQGVIKEAVAYPNPVRAGQHVSIICRADGLSEPDVQLVDLLGQSYTASVLSAGLSKEGMEYILYTDGYPPGIYYIHARSGESRTILQLLIVP